MPMALGHPARLCLAVTQRTCDVVIARTLCRLLLVFQHHSIRYALPEHSHPSIQRNRLTILEGDSTQIAILGAGGFVGSHLVEHLLSRGEHSVVGLDVSDEKLAGICNSTKEYYQECL